VRNLLPTLAHEDSQIFEEIIESLIALRNSLVTGYSNGNYMLPSENRFFWDYRVSLRKCPLVIETSVRFTRFIRLYTFLPGHPVEEDPSLILIEIHFYDYVKLETRGLQ